MATRRSITTQLVALVCLLAGLVVMPAAPAAAQSVPAGQCISRSSTLASGVIRLELVANQYVSSSGCAAAAPIGAATLAGWGANQYTVVDVGYNGPLYGYVLLNNAVPGADYAPRAASFSTTSSVATLGGQLLLQLRPAAATESPWSGAVYVLYRPFPGAPAAAPGCASTTVLPNQDGPTTSLTAGIYSVVTFWTEGAAGQSGNPYFSVKVGGSFLGSAGSDATSPQGFNVTWAGGSGAVRVDSAYITSPITVQFCRQQPPSPTVTATAAPPISNGCQSVDVAQGQLYYFSVSARFHVFFDGPNGSEGSLYSGQTSLTQEVFRFHDAGEHVYNQSPDGIHALSSGRNTMQYRICQVPDITIDINPLNSCRVLDIFPLHQHNIFILAAGIYQFKHTGGSGSFPVGIYWYEDDATQAPLVHLYPGETKTADLQHNKILVDMGDAETGTTIEICPIAPPATATVPGGQLTPTVLATRTAIATTTARPALTATGTRTPIASRTATRTPSASPSASPTVTGTPPIAADCPVQNSYLVPVSPGTVVLALRVGMRFFVADAAIAINIGSQARPIPPGAYRWNVGDGDFTAYSLTTPARVLICELLEQITATATQIAGGAPDDIGVCVAAEPTPQDISGAGPLLDFSVPTLAPLPTLITATVTISASGFISGSLRIGTAVAGPALQLGAWTDTQFGPDGWQKGANDAAPIVAIIAGAFGWLAFFSMLGPLNWVLPPVLLTLLVRLVRALLSIVKWVKQILPFQ